MAWNAQPMISTGGDGWFTVFCRVHADSVSEALVGAEFVLNALAGGKLAAIRHAPSGEEKVNLDTKAVTYEGYVRFSFRDEPGEWKYPDRAIEGVAMTAFGLGSCTT